MTVQRCMADELAAGVYCDQPATAVRETYRADHPIHLCAGHAGPPPGLDTGWYQVTTGYRRIADADATVADVAGIAPRLLLVEFVDGENRASWW